MFSPIIENTTPVYPSPTANPSALSEKAVSKLGLSMVSKERKLPSSPNGDFEVDPFESSGLSDIAKEWMDDKRIDRDRDEDSRRRQDPDMPAIIHFMKEELKKKKVKQQGRLK